MEKLLTIIIALTMVFVFAGCGLDKNNSNSSVSNFKSNSDILINTEYYTLSVPNSWKSSYSYEVSSGENGTYVLSFYENKSHESIEGGWLFSIILLTENEDYTYYPSYDILGSVEVTNTGSYNLIAIYPTDVQFTSEAAKTYNEMSNSVADILKTISFKDICAFSKEPIPVESQTE